jgi:hypothetical protein
MFLTALTADHSSALNTLNKSVDDSMGVIPEENDQRQRLANRSQNQPNSRGVIKS